MLENTFRAEIIPNEPDPGNAGVGKVLYVSDNISINQFTITFNGEPLSLTTPISLDNFLELKKLTTKQGLAIALNDRVIPRSRWKEITLKMNDQVLAIIPTQGG